MPRYPLRMKNRISLAPYSSTASRFTFAQRTGHRLWSFLGSPSWSTASTGKYSPKSAIQPDMPRSSMFFFISTSLTNRTAAGSVRSSMPASKVVDLI